VRNRPTRTATELELRSKVDVSEIAALAPGTAVHSKGRKRVQEIITTATPVLAFEGYSAFTMRNIAAKLGISLRNLQYYFQTKSDLFQAVVEQMIRSELDSGRRSSTTPSSLRWNDSRNSSTTASATIRTR
jgi:AcrR family transcriptional regulator